MKIGLAGFGAIARTQHLPAIARLPGAELVAVASPDGGPDGIPWYPDLSSMLAAEPAVDAVAICTPPRLRRELAAAALEAGRHVLLEKPPGATISELASLLDQAQRSGLTLFAAWHSRFAPAVDPARALVARHGAGSVRMRWKEDSTVWHAGQRWIWEPGGFGVFDPGINGLSVLTRVIAERLFVAQAELLIGPEGEAPAAAELVLRAPSGLTVQASLDFRQPGAPCWEIEIETARGTLLLSEGGASLSLDGQALPQGRRPEYDGVYERFRALVMAGASEVDATPLQLVADAFLVGRRRHVD